jgi:superfamily II DNA or RNA helicase
VALRLFEHNERAYHAAVRMMEQYGKAAIVHPTGTGKSYIAFKLIEDNPEATVLWLSPSEYIFKTQVESLKRNDPVFPLANVHFYTYAKLMCCTQAQLDDIAAQKPAYIILDEFHRAGAECWGESTVALLKLCSDAKLLGLTATNIRYLDNNRDMAEELFDSRVASDMTLGEAIVRGILPAPNYVTTVYQYQKDLARYQTRVDNLRSPGIQDVNQKYLDALRRALEQADGLDKVFAHHITNKSGKYIVFCANKEHMDEMISHVPEWFAKVNAEVAVYEAYSDDPGTDKAFADFKTDESDKLKLLFCIDMLNEGVHVEGISGVILFRPTISPIIYKQQIGRALTAGDTAAPLILDVVNNFEGLTSISGLQGEMQEAVHRLYANGEGDKIITERFEVIEQVHDCRVLFEQLQASLSSSWDHYFSEASIYYAEHGSLNIPKRYTTPAGLSLGEWLTTQRRVRAGQIPGNLTEQQIARLDSIGMEWGNRNDAAWERGLEEARKFREQFGNLQVPAKYKTKDDYPLGKWINNARKRRNDGKLTEERIRQLDQMGMIWSVFDAKWEQGYALAMNYAAKHGDLNVPVNYTTEEGEKLGAWILNQRTAYVKEMLSQDQIGRLEKIGIYWGNRNDRQWNEVYGAAKRYFEANGDLDVPVAYVSPEGYALGKWVRRQQYAYRNPEKSNAILSQERIELLDAVGMQWEKPDSWQHRYELAQEYKKQYGNLEIPAKYKTADGIWLSRWVYNQKRLLQSGSGKLSEEQKEQLEKLLNGSAIKFGE